MNTKMMKPDETIKVEQQVYYQYDIYTNEYKQYWDEEREKPKYETVTIVYVYTSQHLLSEEEIEKKFREVHTGEVTVFKVSEPNEVRSSSLEIEQTFKISELPFRDFSTSQDDIIEKIKNGKRSIQYIYNPSQGMCLASIEYDIENVKYIGSKLDEEGSLFVIRKDPEKLEFTGSKNIRVQIAAVSIDPKVIRHLKYYDSYPTEEAQFIAVKADITNTKLIARVSEEVQMYVIGQDITNVKYIYNPTEKVQLLALEVSIDNFKLIQNATEKVNLLALQEDSSSIQYIYTPSKEMQLIAVKDDCSNIQYINHPNEEVQLFVLEVDIDNFNLIDLPTRSAKLFYEERKY